MKASVIIRSKDEADRLRLTLTSLACQTQPAEVVVVNDGSTDHTSKVIAQAATELDVVAIHHASPAGRSEAANVGAAKASGDIVIFLDGDTLAEPDFVARHLERHTGERGMIVRGETWHLRCTRPFLDPETGAAKPGEEARVAKMSANERARALVTRDQIRTNFLYIDRRAQPGIYPGFGPRKLYDLEMEALRADVDCGVLWAAASGANQSVSKAAFQAAGGFHPSISINEHRELALRLCQAGLAMTATTARSYHMTHRSGWRDPLEDLEWEDVFYSVHPRADVALLPLFWQSLSDGGSLPDYARIGSLAQLATEAAHYEGLEGREAVRQAYFTVRAKATHVVDHGSAQ